MTGRPWYAFYPDAYERDAGTLSYVQDSAYRRMLDHYYKTGEPLSLDKEEIYRACRAMRKEERTAIDFSLGKFFDRRDDGYHQDRADDEIARASEISAKRADAANKRHSKNNASEHANAETMQPHLHTHSTATSTATTSEDKSSSVSKRAPSVFEPLGFKEFYDAYPLKKAKPAATKAYARALTRASGAVLLTGAQRYAESRKNEDQNFTKHPATWLNNDCWLDQEVSRETNRNNGSGKKSALDIELAGIADAGFDMGGPDHRPPVSETADTRPAFGGSDAGSGEGGIVTIEGSAKATDAGGMAEPLRDAQDDLAADRVPDQLRPANSTKNCDPEIPAFLLRPRVNSAAGNSRGLRALSAGTEPGRQAEIFPADLADQGHGRG